MEKKMIRISTSLLAANFKHLDKEIKKIIKSKSDWLHLDVMDGNFVDNISFGSNVCKAVSDYPIFKDIHLMITNPTKYALEYINYHADLLTFHYESLKYKKDIKNLIKMIHDNNVLCGISIKPKTDIKVLLPYLKNIDVVLIMSVEPGFGGQAFDENAINKISELRKIIDENNYNCLIEVDGGINDKTSKKVIKAGADILVSGSYLFKSEDMKESIKKLKTNL